MPEEPKQDVVIRYTNHRGETALRRILPKGILFAPTRWHPEAQWILVAHDLDRDAERFFAMNDILEWNPKDATPPAPD